MQLTPEQYQRYARHTVLPQIGVPGQKKLLQASVLLVGLGGLGSPVALYLAAAGVGRLGLVDFDQVDLSNLQRQVLHSEAKVGMPKLDSARERLHSINSGLEIVTHATRLSAANALDILRDYDIVIDGTDNFPTRYLTNDACVLLGKPNIYGAIHQFEGQASVFFAPHGPCYRCLFPEPPSPGAVPTCAEAGVMGIVPGTIGLVQATEAIKLILGVGESLVGRLLLYDALRMAFRSVKVPRNPDCPICGTSPTITQLVDYEEFCQLRRKGAQPDQISVEQLRREMEQGAGLTLIDVRNADEHAMGHIGGSLLLPLGELEEHLERLDALKQSPLVVYCQLGGRSLQACSVLKGVGFGQVRNLRGGFAEWQASGQEVAS